MSNPIDKTIEDFFKSPRLDRFRKIQLLVSESSDYDPTATAVVSLETQISRGNDVSKSISLLSQQFQICPRFHYVSARAFEKLGKAAQTRTAIQKMQLCIRALAATGEGNRESPIRATYLTDPDDIVRAFGESVRCQQLVVTPDGYRDVLTAHSGQDFWFDIEALLERTSDEAVSSKDTSELVPTK